MIIKKFLNYFMAILLKVPSVANLKQSRPNQT